MSIITRISARGAAAALAALCLSAAPAFAQLDEILPGASEAAQDAMEAVGEAASDAGQSIQDGAESALDAAGEMADDAMEAAESATEAAKEALGLSEAEEETAAIDFSEGSEAREWGLPAGETKARFTATVVDVLCELTGDCPENCGERRRQLGLLREADGKLILPAKNAQPIFTGAVIDLEPYCGQVVEVDGVMVGDELPAPLYLLQRIKGEDEEEWSAANRFSKVWIAENEDVLNLPGRWFNKDPRITSRIEENGRLGLGKEADAAFAEEWF
ncbi:MAG: hypothetical protein AAGM38_06930 [Pseudomonadota bacterium]